MFFMIDVLIVISINCLIYNVNKPWKNAHHISPELKIQRLKIESSVQTQSY